MTMNLDEVPLGEFLRYLKDRVEAYAILKNVECYVRPFVPISAFSMGDIPTVSKTVHFDAETPPSSRPEVITPGQFPDRVESKFLGTSAPPPRGGGSFGTKVSDKEDGDEGSSSDKSDDFGFSFADTRELPLIKKKEPKSRITPDTPVLHWNSPEPMVVARKLLFPPTGIAPGPSEPRRTVISNKDFDEKSESTSGSTVGGIKNRWSTVKMKETANGQKCCGRVKSRKSKSLSGATVPRLYCTNPVSQRGMCKQHFATWKSSHLYG